MSQTFSSNELNFITLDRFDAIEYDSIHLWEMQIDGAPSPFNQWFPAQTVDEPSKGASVSPQSFGIEEINTLNAYSSVNLRTEILDDANATLELWLRSWQKGCSAPDYYGFRYIDEILKKARVTKYNWQKEKIYTNEYYVMPSGDINISKGNEPGIKILNVNFASFGMKSI